MPLLSLKTPAFWYRSPQSSHAPPLERALRPLSSVYQRLHSFNQSLKPPYSSALPVICVGNAVAGGSGKTPTTIALHKLLSAGEQYNNPVFITRGYKSSLQSPVLIDPKVHSFAQAGDESLLLAAHGATILSKNRAEGAKLAAQSPDFNAIILDDGLQNLGLEKDFSLLVVDGLSGFGNLQTLPAGPLREPLSQAFAKSDAVVLIGKDKNNVRALLPPEKPLFHAHVKAVSESLPPLDTPIVAFCGLGQPQKFYHFLHSAGYQIAEFIPFADHHAYTQKDLDALKSVASKHCAALVTTEKDFMRLKNTDIEALLKVIRIEITFDNPAALLECLTKTIAQKRQKEPNTPC
ncbi:MAG: tetraacyldisaccharide 4'-kinase [Alphaproteobacteria bacterium]